MIFDTNALLAFSDGDKALIPLLMRAPRHQIPVIVLGEYRYGLLRSRDRIRRERWLDELERSFDILDISRNTARYYAQVREELRTTGRPIPENDVWIAAVVREHGLELLSKDHHFDEVSGIARRSW